MMDVDPIPLPQLSLPGPTKPAEPYDLYRGTQSPLVIDNGSTTLRWGFGSVDTPFTGLNAVAKYKERRTNKPLLLFGEAIDAESGAKGQTRTPWEGDVLLNFDALENALDYAFVHLGVDTPTVEHPVIMSERLCTPLHSRALTSELMFELYGVPRLTYCVDSVMSFYQNHQTTPFTSDGLILSFNTHSTSVIPMLKGKGIMSHTQRIPWGAAQSSDYLLKLIQLKYPTFPTRVTPSQTNWMYRTFCEFTPSYPTLLKSFTLPHSPNSPHPLIPLTRPIQFPYLLPVLDDKSPTELARIAEKRKEQGKKLQELAAKSRLEKLAQKQTDLQYLLDLRADKPSEPRREYAKRLANDGFENEAALDDTIKKLETYLKKARRKELNNNEDSTAGDNPMDTTEPSFPLLDTPDDELDEEGLKEKKKQKLLKSNWDFRLRARKEKEREAAEREREAHIESLERQNDLAGWSSRLRKEHQHLISKIKDRTRRKTALGDRKSAAAQARMKNIANLAEDDIRVPKKKNTRKGAGGPDDTDDLFGADDADWQIYRKINATAASSDEEDDLNTLLQIEEKLLTHDPSFTPSQTHASITAASLSSPLLTAFRPVYPETDPAGLARIHLNIERFRVPETYFAPSMAGVDTAGLGEVIQTVLARFTQPETKGRLVQNVFLTGAPSQVPGLKERLEATLRPILDPDMSFAIHHAQDPALDAWKGMAAYSRTEEAGMHGVTRAEYDEWGGERVKKWWGGNTTGSM